MRPRPAESPHAEAWAAEQESLIGRDEKPSTKPATSRETSGDRIDPHLEDVKEVGRSKEHTPFWLKDTTGDVRLSDIDRELLVNFAKRRAKEGAACRSLRARVARRI